MLLENICPGEKYHLIHVAIWDLWIAQDYVCNSQTAPGVTTVHRRYTDLKHLRIYVLHWCNQWMVYVLIIYTTFDIKYRTKCIPYTEGSPKFPILPLPLCILRFLRLPTTIDSENITLNAWTDWVGTGGKKATGTVPVGANPAAMASGPDVGVVGNGVPPPTVDDFKLMYCNYYTPLKILKIFWK